MIASVTKLKRGTFLTLSKEKPSDKNLLKDLAEVLFANKIIYGSVSCNSSLTDITIEIKEK